MGRPHHAEIRTSPIRKSCRLRGGAGNKRHSLKRGQARRACHQRLDRKTPQPRLLIGSEDTKARTGITRSRPSQLSRPKSKRPESRRLDPVSFPVGHREAVGGTLKELSSPGSLTARSRDAVWRAGRSQSPSPDQPGEKPFWRWRPSEASRPSRQRASDAAIETSRWRDRLQTVAQGRRLTRQSR